MAQASALDCLRAVDHAGLTSNLAAHMLVEGLALHAASLDPR